MGAGFTLVYNHFISCRLSLLMVVRFLGARTPYCQAFRQNLGHNFSQFVALQDSHTLLIDFYLCLVWSLTVFFLVQFVIFAFMVISNVETAVANSFLSLSTCHSHVVLRVLILALSKGKFHICKTYIITSLQFSIQVT